MNPNVREDRLLVISDLHLGRWFVDTTGPLHGFLEYAAEGGFHLCINGDGFDVRHSSIVGLADELIEALDYLGQLVSGESRVYYVVGNHDIILEHHVDALPLVRLAPFLNVRSGDARIRIEHGHLYDPFFVRNPDLYFLVTRMSDFFVRIHPVFYGLRGLFRRGRHAVRRAFEGREERRLRGIPGESTAFVRAAAELTARGFDAVIFGHTHQHGTVELGDGRTYLNTGSWFHRPHYVKIEGEDFQLLPWKS
jgi:UDP-2,3-diacylglucosamine pyrophosphatase LpxH